VPVDFRLERADRARRLLAHLPGGVQRAMYRAINRAIVAARTSMSKQIRRKYKIPAKIVRPSFRVRKATRSKLGASLDGKGLRLPLAEFGPRPSEPGTGGAGKPDMRVKVRKDTGRAKPVPGGFIARQGLVARRKGKERTPLEFLYGPAVPQMAGNEDVLAGVEERAQAVLDKRLDHEVDFELRRAAK